MEDLRQGYFVKVVVAGRTEVTFYRLGAPEPFLYITGDGPNVEFTSVSAGSESGFKNIDNVDPNERPKRLQFTMWGVRDGCQYFIKIPTGTNRLGTDKDLDVGYITCLISPYFAPDEQFGFWLIHDFYPAVNAKNVTAAAVTPKVWFKGIKYDIEEIPVGDLLTKLLNYEKNISPNMPFTTISIGGVKT